MHDIDRSKLIIQEDNGPKHASKSAKNRMEKNGFNVGDRSNNSLDMNPIENL